jgi:hypothetical protein
MKANLSILDSMVTTLLRVSLALIFVLPCAHILIAQTQVVISADKDNTLIQTADGSLSNGAGQNFFVGRTNQGSGYLRRGVIAFDIAGSIPSGALIQSVTLTLNMSKTRFNTTQTISIHRLESDWGEGSSNATGGSGAPSTTGDATWIHTFFSTASWANAGGDYDPFVTASQAVSGVGSYTWGSTASMVGDVQAWLDDPSTNFGWILIGNENSSSTAKRFDSRENVNPNARPKLIVTYMPTVGVKERSPTPSSFVLHQNYPNPFNPSTRIRFDLQTSGHISLRVYDVLGKVVATLAEGTQTSGSYEVAWDAGVLPAGIYFCRLQSTNGVSVRRMTLLK